MLHSILGDGSGDCLSPEAVAAYREGKLSGEALHTVERHLLDCPLCSVAYGNEALSAEEISAGAEAISAKAWQRVAKRERKRRAAAWTWMSAAAGIALLIVVGWLMISQSEDRKMENAFTQAFENSLMPEPSEGGDAVAAMEEDSDPALLKMSEPDSLGIAGNGTPTGELRHNPIADAAPAPPQAEDKRVAKADAPQRKLEENAEEIDLADIESIDEDMDADNTLADPKPARVNDGAANGWADDAEIKENFSVPMQDNVAISADSAGFLYQSMDEIVVMDEPSPDFVAAPKLEGDDYVEMEDVAVREEKRNSNRGIFGGRSKDRASAAQEQDAVAEREVHGNAGMVDNYRIEEREVAVKTYKERDFATSVQHWKNVVTASPNDMEARLFYGICLLKVERPSEALTQFDRVLQGDQPAFKEDANWYKALSLLALRRKAEAKELLRQISVGGGKYTDNAKATLNNL